MTTKVRKGGGNVTGLDIQLIYYLQLQTGVKTFLNTSL